MRKRLNGIKTTSCPKYVDRPEREPSGGRKSKTEPVKKKHKLWWAAGENKHGARGGKGECGQSRRCKKRGLKMRRRREKYDGVKILPARGTQGWRWGGT